MFGDATMICSGLEFLNEIITSESESREHIITELIPNKSYSCRSYVETVEGGRIYSTQKSFTTKSITTNTLPVSNISNRSATMNGTIECDDISSAEFGFQWKQMEGWVSDPAFTKGRKLDDSSISVTLVMVCLNPIQITNIELRCVTVMKSTHQMIGKPSGHNQNLYIIRQPFILFSEPTERTTL